MNSKLIVNGTELDLSENIAVPLNLSISDVKEPEKRKRSYSKSIKLEGTSNNMAFFLSAYSLSMDVENSSNVSFDPAIRNPCEFYKNDLLIFKGKLKLNEVIIQDKNYYFDCTLFSDVVDIFTKLKDKKLNELDWSEYNHNLTRSNVVNSWVSGIKLNGVDNRNFGADDYGFQPKSYGYIYPIVDYGFQKYNNSPTTFRTNQLYPFIYVKEALQKILSDALQDENIEVDYTTSFFTNANMQKLIYGYGGGEQLKLNSAQVDTMKVDIDGGLPSQTITGKGIYNKIGSTTTLIGYEFGKQWNVLKSMAFSPAPVDNINKVSTINGEIQILANGFYDIDFTADLTLTFSGDRFASNIVNLQMSIEVDGVQVNYYSWYQNKTVTTTNNVKASLNLKAGQSVKFYFYFNYKTKTDSTIDYDFNNIHINLNAKETVIDGSLITLNSSIPDIKCSEFLKGIMNLFYAYMSDPIYDPLTNKSTIYIDSFINYYEDASVYDEWTNKVDNQKEITIQSNSLVEGSNYIYKFSDEKDYFNAKYKELTGLNYCEKSIQLSTWASGDVKFELPFNTYVPSKPENTEIIYARIIDQSIDNNGNTTIKPYKGKGMLTFYNGIRGGDVTIMNSNDDDNTKPLAYPFLHHIRYKNNLNFEPLFDLHFASRNYTFDGLNAIPNQNTFDYYHAKFVNEITSQNSKLLSLYLNLDYKDIHDLDFSKLKMIDGILYRLNAIKDFDSDAYGTTQVELLKYLG
jgi:hypothetical protein